MTVHLAGRPASRRTEPEALTLLPEELGAVRHLHPQRLLRVVLRGEAAREAAPRLAALGFVPVPIGIGQLLDLRPFTDVEAYVRALPNNRERRKVARCLRIFEESGARSSVVACADADPGLAARFYSEVLLPAASHRAINPYMPLSAPVWQRMQAAEQDAWLLTIERDGRLLAGAVWRVVASHALASEYAGVGHGGRCTWDRTLDPAGRALELVCAHTHPTGAGPELGAALPIVLYWSAIRWAIERRMGTLSAGSDPPGVSGPYLGVQFFKRKWDTSTAVFEADDVVAWERFPAAAFFAARMNAAHVRRAPSGLVMRCVVASEDDVIRMLLTSDPHLKKEVLVASPRAAEGVRRLCDREAVEADVLLWAGED